MNKKLIMCSYKEKMDWVCDRFEPAEGTETISYEDYKAEILKLATEIKSIDDLPEVCHKILDGYFHTYSTIVDAIGACCIAAAWAADRSGQGGITGFQAGGVMWYFIRNYMYRGNKVGLKITDYDDMLFPQYEYKYEKTIPRHIFESLQKAAKEKLEKEHSAHPLVAAHWMEIVGGKVPFGYKIEEN